MEGWMLSGHAMVDEKWSLSILLAILVLVRGDGKSQPSTYCRHINCRLAAAEILVRQNQSVNPCNDFYAHACAGQKKSVQHDPFFYVAVTIHGQISELFKNVQPSDMEALKKSKRFQDACTDRAAIERRGLTPVARILSDNGEWPVTVPSDKWNNRNLGWLEIHENFAKRTGISALFDVTVEIDRSNPSVHILSLSVPTVPFERPHFMARTKRNIGMSTEYRRYLGGVVEEIKKLRGFNVEYADMLADCLGIIAFENELHKLAIDLDEQDNENVDDLRITTIETLQNDWDAIVPRISDYSINWLNAINDRFEGTGIVIDASEKIALKPGAFVANFARALLNTPVRTIVNYIHWKVVDNLLPFTSTNLSHPYATEQIHADVAGLCINNHKMIHAVAYMYVKRHLSVQTKTAALEMVQKIKDEFKREISESSWLDDATKSVARKKIDAMENFVGYPEWYDEPGKIDEYYGGLAVGPDHFENVLACNKFEAKKKLLKLRSPVEKSETEWIALPYVLTAEYLHQLNSLIVPAAILQSPFFLYERPSVLNYGSLGAIIGHEIAHGFDTIGRHYDADGNKRKWWPQSAIDTYKTKAQCFVKQYDKYTIRDVNKKTVLLNGTKTQRENIADAIGFRAGLRAYQRLRIDGKTNNVKIRLLSNFTDDQLYFYELVSTMCAPEPARAEAFTGLDAHSPKRLRIIGALSNMQEFADAFQCPPGSPMNPPEKCLIWD